MKAHKQIFTNVYLIEADFLSQPFTECNLLEVGKYYMAHPKHVFIHS